MKQILLFQVDAFTSQLFKGNPAAVCPLEEWFPEEILQSIAAENNLSETAFFVHESTHYSIRWFTPKTEVDLCGHATLATAHVLFNHLGVKEKLITFHSKSGVLTVREEGELIILDFPSVVLEKTEAPPALIKGIGKTPSEIWKADDYLLLYPDQAVIETLSPDFTILDHVDARGIIVTAPGNNVDFVSRFFAPAVGIPEDPVTGSAHTKLIPFWSERTGKKDLIAHQLSRRGGELFCKLKGDRVEIGGKAITFMTGKILLPETFLMNP